jgi:hypothetical protein
VDLLEMQSVRDVGAGERREAGQWEHCWGEGGWRARKEKKKEERETVNVCIYRSDREREREREREIEPAAWFPCSTCGREMGTPLAGCGSRK